MGSTGAPRAASYRDVLWQGLGPPPRLVAAALGLPCQDPRTTQIGGTVATPRAIATPRRVITTIPRSAGYARCCCRRHRGAYVKATAPGAAPPGCPSTERGREGAKEEEGWGREMKRDRRRSKGHNHHRQGRHNSRRHKYSTMHYYKNLRQKHFHR